MVEDTDDVLPSCTGTFISTEPLFIISGVNKVSVVVVFPSGPVTVVFNVSPGLASSGIVILAVVLPESPSV